MSKHDSENCPPDTSSFEKYHPPSHTTQDHHQRSQLPAARGQARDSSFLAHSVSPTPFNPVKINSNQNHLYSQNLQPNRKNGLELFSFNSDTLGDISNFEKVYD